MSEVSTHRHFVRMSDQVVARDDLDRRLRSVMAHLDHSSTNIAIPSGRPPSAIESATSRAEHLHQLWATLAPPILQLQPGRRARLGYLAKRIVRRLTSWYVEPRWAAQREFDAETARFTSDATDAIRSLLHDIEELQFTNERLLRRLHACERAGPAPALRIEPTAPR